jgi:inorganic triphosphatase YgiF
MGSMSLHPPGADAEPAREIELKLQLEASAQARVTAFPGFVRRAVGPATERPLHSVYYDTSDLALLEAGLALRTRQVGPRMVQTVKGRAGTRAGLFERLEVECDLSGSEPDPSSIPDGALRSRVEGLVAGRPLEPVLETEVRRKTQRLREGSSLIDADLDVGSIRTPNGSLPICELELELVEGDAAALYALALELAREVPLRLATESKFDRGLALLTGAKPVPVRARVPSIDGSAPLEVALAAILSSALEQVLANESPARAGEDPEGVHQMRVGVRRLRSALGLFRPLLPRDECEGFRKELRDLAGVLGGARDLDVFIEQELEPMRQRTGSAGAFGALYEEAERLRDERYAELRQHLDSGRYSQLVLELGGWIARRGWRDQPLSPRAARLFQPAAGTARRLLERRYKKTRRLGRDLGTSHEKRHELRVQIKKLRYASEFLGGAFPGKRARAYAKKASAAQDALGRLNDLVQARELLALLSRRLGRSDGDGVEAAAGFVLGWAAREADDVIEIADAAWRRLRKTDPFWR